MTNETQGPACNSVTNDRPGSTSRRSFLATSAAAGVGLLVFARRARAAQSITVTSWGGVYE